MQSVDSSLAQVVVDWSSSDGDDSDVFLSEEEPAELSKGHGRSSTSSLYSSSSSSSLGLGWRGTSGEGGGLKDPAGETQGDLLFAKKCLELQGFVRPLMELLNGLKNGRFEKGLSSFQQSLAMDRIQRIVGVLQKPHIGARYLPTLLQVEIMLKHWFPQVILTLPQPAQTSAPTLRFGQIPSCSSLSLHRHKDQLHIPVKKRKLSWSDSDYTCTPPAGLCKRPHLTTNDKNSHESPTGSKTPPSSTPGGNPSGCTALRWSEPSLTWVHVAPIPSPPKTSHKTAEGGSSHIPPTHPPPACRTNPATQDNAVSSTTFISESTASQNQTEATQPTARHEETPPITTQVSSSVQS